MWVEEKKKKMEKKSDEEESWLLEYADIKFKFILRIEIFFCPEFMTYRISNNTIRMNV